MSPEEKKSLSSREGEEESRGVLRWEEALLL